jgi:polyhydroxyalkanoate synthesis regulator protein
MYDTEDKKYISQDRLAALIKTGEEVQIIENTTGEDITASIVSQLLAKENKGAEQDLPTGVLFQLLRKGGGTLTDYAKKYSALWQNALTMAEDEIDRRLRALVKKKEISVSEGHRLKDEILGYTSNLKRWIGEQTDRRINEALDRTHLATREQIDELTAKIDALTAKVESLETHQHDQHGADGT